MATEWELEFGTERPMGLDHLMRTVVDTQMAAKMTAAQRAAAAWYRANGDRERTHTTGVFLKRPRRPDAAPILGVYVDSHAMATDFGVNKDIYLARLANVGLEVSGIEFLPTREGSRMARVARTEASPATAGLPDLSEQERQEVSTLAATVPTSMRESVSKAIELSMKREKKRSTQD